ncbi:MAG: nucleotidyltransferase domain-containing protein [Gemmatimonadota bacterium]
MASGKTADPRTIATELAGALGTELGQELHGVLLYGSVAREEAVRGISDINVLILVDTIDGALLARTAPLARRWAEQGVSPLLIEEAEWRRASDVFAIEVLDMQDAHVLLHGRDPVAGLRVDPAQLRLQTEREIRARQVQFHNGLLAAAHDPAHVGAVLAGALPAFVTYLRAALRLAGQTVPRATAATIQAGAALVDADPAAFLQVHEQRQRGKLPSITLDDPLVAGFNEAAARTARYVDQAAVATDPVNTQEGSST